MERDGAVADRPLRADAERNRRRILAAAAELFAARGLEVSLDEVAAHAGVGVGTVYRRFPHKDALIEALFEARIAEVAAEARRALEVEDAWEAFAGFLSRACQLQAADRGLKEALLSHGEGRERVAKARATIAPLAIRLLRRAQASGQVRADLGPLDVPMMQMMLSAAADATRDISPEYWKRLMTIVLDGLAVARDAPTPLPGRPLDPEQFAQAMTRAPAPARPARATPPLAEPPS